MNKFPFKVKCIRQVRMDYDKVIEFRRGRFYDFRLPTRTELSHFPGIVAVLHNNSNEEHLMDKQWMEKYFVIRVNS